MNILVAIDASTATPVILKELCRRNWGKEFVLRLLYVQHSGSFTSDFVDVESYVEAEYEAAVSLLKKSVQQLAECGIEASYVILKGKPAKNILNYATTWGADLIMLGSHGHSSISTLFLGSTAKEILRRAPCSIEIVRASSGQCVKEGGLKILLATEGSSCSLAAVRALASQLWNKIAEVKVVSIVQETSPAIESFAGLALMSAVLPEQIGEQLRTAAKLATTEARSILEAKGITVTEEVLFGDVKMNITEYADEWGADVIVVGSHGRHGIERLFEGSISESVALHAPCSVAVIHEPTQQS